jgi:DNA invertase Pin-like site-specific DNA recombinase
MKSTTKYFLYTRKSTDERDRQVMSLDSQINELRAFASRERVFVYEIVEESKTAKQPGRPQFNQILDRIERGEANGLLCWDIDRLYRNPIDEGRVRWLLQKGVIASICTPTRQFFPEDAGLLMGVEGGRATDYIIRLAKNVRRGVREKLRRGEWPGATKPLGYVYDHRLRNIVPDPEKAPIVQSVFAEYCTGRYSLKSMAARLVELGIQSRGGRPWSNWAVWQFLTNRIYIGLMDWNGEVFEGKYKPLIEPDLFKKVQHVLKIKSKPRNTRKGHNFPFCGVFRCSCGSMISAQWGKGNGGSYRYCRCTRKNGGCAEPYVREESVATQCVDMLRNVSLTADEVRIVRRIIDEEAANEGQTLAVDIKQVTDRLGPLQDKLDRLTRGYLDQLIDEDSYRRAKEELVMEKAALKREKERLQKSHSSYWIEPARAVVNTLESAAKAATATSYHELAGLVQKIGTNRLISGKTVSFSVSAPYDFVACLRASERVSASNTLTPRSGENSEHLKWCVCLMKSEPILNGTDGALRAPNCSGEAGRKRGVGKMNARLALAFAAAKIRANNIGTPRF